MRKKGLVALGLTAMISLSFPMLSHALEREMVVPNLDGTVLELWSDSNWYLLKTDGTYAKNEWIWCDSDNDGVAECFYYTKEGYFFRNGTTPDNYTVNNDGAWTVDGVVQTKAVEPIKIEYNAFYDTNGDGVLDVNEAKVKALFEYYGG